MKKIITLSLYLIICLSCAVPQPNDGIEEQPITGHERVFQAVQSPKMTGASISRFGLISTALSSANLDPKKPLKSLGDDPVPGSRLINMDLQDGTKIGGLLFMHPLETAESIPLLMEVLAFCKIDGGLNQPSFINFIWRKNQTESRPTS